MTALLFWVRDLPQVATTTCANGRAGRRIVELQTSLALISSPQPTTQWPRDSNGTPVPDDFGRKPYLHPALNGLQGLTEGARETVLSKQRLSQLAERYGLDKVTRWTPKRVGLAVHGAAP